MTSLIQRKALAALGLLAALLLPALNAHADLATDLNALNTEAGALKTQLAGIQLSADGVCTPLVAANRAARDLADSVTQLDESLAAPLQVDAAVLDAFDNFSVTAGGLANEALRLSTDLQLLSDTASALTLKDGITAMLQLSTDIGTMADRIGEMADKILLMSDDIGTMADRIIATQELQNQNVALTTQSILQTQTNALALVQVVEDSSYNFTLEALTAEGYALSYRMHHVSLSPWNMDDQLAYVAADVRNYLDSVKTASGTIDTDTLTSTMFSSAMTLGNLGNLTLMLKSLGDAVDGYTIAIQGMEAWTSDPTLYDGLKSMLTLSADIGVMSNRILEMADQILVMSDNIGLQADQILDTQQAMNGNIAVVQGSILDAQQMSIDLIADRDL